MLITDINKPGLDGVITHNSTTEERYAVQTGGVDVKVYATGIRTACAGTLHTNWEWYVTDNGPNVRRKCARVTRKCARVRRK